MKTIFCLAVSLLIFAVGCEESSNQTTASGSGATNSSGDGSLVTAPVDYLAAAARGQQSAVKTVDTTAINKAIELFQIDKGRNPKDLNELVKTRYLPAIPATPHGTRLDYDPKTGVVKIVPQ